MTYREALAYLEGLGRFGLRPGLDTVRALAACAGHPEGRLRFIHVAGTNGKGSTCAFLEAMCREAGLKVGLYTSPHLVSFRERIQVDREPITESAVAEWVGVARDWVTSERGWVEAHPTFFEMVTVMALAWFERQGCDLVIWETGLGGRLDATNLVTPMVSAITNIGWDHMEWLGQTLPEIAREKAGIIKPGVPAVTTEREGEVLDVLRGVAQTVGAPFRNVDPDDAEWAAYQDVPLALLGAHQRRNAVLALAAVDAAGLTERLGREAIRRGLASARWSGRFQVVQRSGRTLVLDGAHNASGLEVLAAAMAEVFPGRRYGLLVGMLADKDPGQAGEWLARGASRVVVVRVASNRGGDPTRLVEVFQKGAGGGEVAVASTLAEGLGWMAGEDLVLVTGSMYLMGEALEWLGGITAHERQLNDWSRRP